MNQILDASVQHLPNFASFGPRSKLEEPYRVGCPERIRVGADVYISAGAWFSVVDEHLGRHYRPRLVIGDGVSIGPDIVIACMGRVEIAERVLVGPRVFIGDTYHDYRDPDTAVLDQSMAEPDPVYIGAGAFLGIGSIILPGVTVGERAYVAAGAVVTASVPPRTLVAGNPARAIKRWDEERQTWSNAGWSLPREPNRHASTVEPAPPSFRAVAVDRTSADPTAADRRIAAIEQRAGLGEARLTDCEKQIEALKLERDRLLELRDDAERRRQAAEFWLEAHRRSLSWRITAPARAAKRRWLEVARRAPR